MSNDPTYAPVNLLYIILGVLTVGFGIAVLIYQTGSTRRALTQRRGMLFAGVLLVLFGGGVLFAQTVTLVKALTGA